MADSALGLAYGQVVLVDYTPEWARAFEAEHLRLRAALEPLECRIEHIGSTSVPGLIAKPILDIAVGIAAARDIERSFAPIESIGYRYRSDAGDGGGHVLVREPEPRVRSHHVHVVHTADPQWSAYLRFRDHLRGSAGARAAYIAEKRALAARYPANRPAYSEGKDDIVARLLAEAS